MSTLVALLNHRDSGRAVEALAKEGICEAVVSALRTHGQVGLKWVEKGEGRLDEGVGAAVRLE